MSSCKLRLSDDTRTQTLLRDHRVILASEAAADAPGIGLREIRRHTLRESMS